MTAYIFISAYLAKHTYLFISFIPFPGRQGAASPPLEVSFGRPEHMMLARSSVRHRNVAARCRSTYPSKRNRECGIQTPEAGNWNTYPYIIEKTKYIYVHNG